MTPSAILLICIEAFVTGLSVAALLTVVARSVVLPILQSLLVLAAGPLEFHWTSVVSYWRAAVITALVIAGVIVMYLALTTPWTEPLPESLSLIMYAGFVWLGSMSTWIILRAASLPVESFLDNIEPYLDAIKFPALGLVVFYFAVAALFGAQFYSTYLEDPGNSFSFKPAYGAQDISRGTPQGEFLFFSLTTLTTVGLSDIHPESPKAKFLVAAELVSGFVVVIILGPLLLLALAPTFGKIARGEPIRSMGSDRYRLRPWLNPPTNRFRKAARSKIVTLGFIRERTPELSGTEASAKIFLPGNLAGERTRIALPFDICASCGLRLPVLSFGPLDRVPENRDLALRGSVYLGVHNCHPTRASTDG